MRRSANDLPKGKAFLHAFYPDLNLIPNVGVWHKNHEALNPGDAISTLSKGLNPDLIALAPLYGGFPRRTVLRSNPDATVSYREKG